MAGLPNRDPTPEEVQNGIKEIRQFHATGKSWLGKIVPKKAHQATLFQAKQFAETFTDAELATLARLVKEHSSLLSRRHIIRVLSVTRRASL